MSDYNRNLFLKRLAKHNVLSVNKMTHFWPKIKQIIVDCPIECILQCNNQTWKKVHYLFSKFFPFLGLV